MLLGFRCILEIQMADADHGWWFPEWKDMKLLDVFGSNASIPCPDDTEYCSP
jgi:hypothetical protein